MSKLYSLFLIVLFISLNGALQTACQSPTNSQQLLPSNVADKTAREQTVAFINVNVLPMDQETTLKNQTVVVRDGKIALVGAADQIKVPENALKVDGRDQFLMPGLADMHVHIRDEKELISYLSYGVTAVLNMRGSPEILRLRTKVEDNEICNRFRFDSILIELFESVNRQILLWWHAQWYEPGGNSMAVEFIRTQKRGRCM